jgi:hypothetical protein
VLHQLERRLALVLQSARRRGQEPARLEAQAVPERMAFPTRRLCRM